MQVLAPLLVYSAQLTMHLYYTGKGDLTPCTLEAPSPHNPSGIFYAGGPAAAAEAGECARNAATSAHTRMHGQGRRLIHATGGAWLEAVMLCAVVLGAFWLFVRSLRIPPWPPP